MGHQQTPQFAPCLLGVIKRSLIFALRFVGAFDQRADLLFRFHLRLRFDDVGFFVGGRLDLIGRALREDQRVLKRFFHRLEMADALAKVRDFRFERGLFLRVVLERFDQIIEELIDLCAVIALQRFLEGLVLNVDWRDPLHRTLTLPRAECRYAA